MAVMVVGIDIGPHRLGYRGACLLAARMGDNGARRKDLTNCIGAIMFAAAR